MAPNYWQVEDNASWKTDVIHKCDVCGKKSRTVINIREDNLGINSFICFLQDRPCFYDFISKTFGINPDLEYVMARVIEYHNRITSYNVCYTKLLRTATVGHQVGFQIARLHPFPLGEGSDRHLLFQKGGPV